MNKYEQYWKEYDAHHGLNGTGKRTRAPSVHGYLLYHLWNMTKEGQ